MQILKVTPTIYTFKPVPCDECSFRFGCWTVYSTCCPLRAVRLIEEEIGNNHFPKYKARRITFNDTLGRFDRLLLTKIGKALDKAYNEGLLK